MAYIDGFIVAVPAANKDAYRKLAADFVAMFKEFGATRQVEAWGAEVPDGKVTDFKRAVKAKDDEIVVFSWLEYPDKATRDAAAKKMHADPRMKDMGSNMPFDGMRMIFGGFDVIHDDGGKATGKAGYVDGVVIPVPTKNKNDYLDSTRKISAIMREYGAARVVDAWGDDVPDGKVTDYKGAVNANADETVVYSWVEWPSKEIRDKAWEKIMADPRMKDHKMPFDGKRMIYGGFVPILDE